MFNGRETTQTLNGETFSLKRPAFSQMHAAAVLAEQILEDREGEEEETAAATLELLKEAAGEKGEALLAALGTVEVGDGQTFLDAYLNFGGFEDFLLKRRKARFERQKKQLEELSKQGLVPEDYLETFMKTQLTLASTSLS